MEVISKRYALKNGKGIFITNVFKEKRNCGFIFCKAWATHSQFSKYKTPNINSLTLFMTHAYTFILT